MTNKKEEQLIDINDRFFKTFFYILIGIGIIVTAMSIFICV